MAPKVSNLGYGMRSLLGATRDKALETPAWGQGHMYSCAHAGSQTLSMGWKGWTTDLCTLSKTLLGFCLRAACDGHGQAPSVSVLQVGGRCVVLAVLLTLIPCR